MARLNLVALLLQTSLLLVTPAQAAWAGSTKTYIVQLDSSAAGSSSSSSSSNRLARRQELISESLTAAAVPNPEGAVVYTYDTVIDGYAAVITDAQANALRAQPGVLSVQRDGIKKLHTTSTPRFLGIDDVSLAGTHEARGMSPNLYSELSRRNLSEAIETDIIVGVLDTGAWPESASYDDTGLPSPPARWTGECEAGPEWDPALHCNNKLIGARAFFKGLEAGFAADNFTYDWSKEYKSPRDAEGHGTHTSTTIGGAEVEGASLYGQAPGTARGMALGARLAIYKVCYKDVGCADSDILAAMDAAIKDGVNIISMSLGGGPGLGGEADSISTGAFAAIEKGVLVSASAGNSGPAPGTVANNAPWLLTVAASSLDRDFPADVVLGDADATRFTGSSLYTNLSVTDVDPIATSQQVPLILSASAAIAGLGNSTNATLCIPGSLDPAKIEGKVVLCTRGGNGRVEKGQVVKDAGAVGMILVNDASSGESLIADPHVLPALILGNSAAAPIAQYISSAGDSATATFDFSGTVFGVPAPQMASFSSRGPNFPAPDVLKPDITGPGVNILAAWNDASPSGLEGDDRKTAFNIISGTSMSCPHLSGVAAYIMARRPEWSVAAIKSAIMTTAYAHLKGDEAAAVIDQADDGAADTFDYGNGHVNPVAALDPGLVYDTTAQDYIDFLCAFNYTDDQIRTITRNNASCDPTAEYSLYDLNYPSFAAWYNTNTTTGEKTVTYHRNVTNVGGESTYTVNVAVADPTKVKITVDPETLSFDAAGQSQIYSVTATLYDPKLASLADYDLSSGRLTWSDGTHTVASSLGFFWGAVEDNALATEPESTLGPI